MDFFSPSAVQVRRKPRYWLTRALSSCGAGKTAPPDWIHVWLSIKLRRIASVRFWSINTTAGWLCHGLMGSGGMDMDMANIG